MKKRRRRTRQEGFYPRRSDGTVRRVVLDTNVLWYEPLSTLSELTSRGFLLSMSEVALTERWARAYRKGELDFVKRARRLNAVLDPHLLAVPISYALEDQLGVLETDVDDTFRFPAFRRTIAERWGELLDGGPVDWAELGTTANTAIAGSAQRWRDDLLEFADLIKDKVVGTTEAELLAGTAEHFKRTLTSSLPGGAGERLSGWCHLQALHAVRTVLGNPPTENDREDLRLLQVLGAPVFVVTNDRKLIDKVLKSGSHQAPWVRTPEQMLHDELPRCLPWGTHAHRAAKSDPRLR